MCPSFKKIISLLMISSMVTLSACNSSSKNIALNNTGMKMQKEITEDSKTKDNLKQLPKEKNILLTTDIKKNLKEQENNSFKLEKLKELDNLDETLTPVCWSDDENIIAIKHIGGLKHSYDVYNIDISKSERRKITSIDYVLPKSTQRAVDTKKLIFLKNFKLCTYNLKDDSIHEIYDLNKIKKDLEVEYANHCIEKEYIAPEIYSYEIVEKQEETNSQFIIKDDKELTLLFDISQVQGSDKYISIISSHSKKGQVIWILNIDSKDAISSKRFNDLNLSFPGQTGFKYNKTNNTFYICANISKDNTQTIYSYKLDNPSTLRELENISNIKISSPVQCPDNENFYFIGDSSHSKNSIMRYNTTNDTLSVIFKDKPEGFYSSLKFINNTNLICFNYEKETLDNKTEEFSFIGVLDQDTIKNIQKLPFDDLYTNRKRNYSIVSNELGNRFICRISDFYKQSSMDYMTSKFYIYKIDNIKKVLKSDSDIINTAKKLLGMPYAWGGSTPEKGFDSSGFVMYVYAQCGIKLPRITYFQIEEGAEVKKHDLKPGDLVFFGTSKNPHTVGIYVGNDHYIHASTSGDIVKISPLSSRDDFVTGRRIFE